MTLGLAACGGDDDTQQSSSTPSSTPASSAPASSEPGTSEAPEKPYKGARIQVYGMGTGIKPDDPESINGGVSTYMVAAAMIEWAHENEATVEFISSYTVDVLSAAVNGGVGPDLVSSYNTFPNYANIGLLGSINAGKAVRGLRR